MLNLSDPYASIQSRGLPASHIALVSDGRSFQLLGILMVVNELLEHSRGLGEQVTVWIGLPEEYHARYDKYFDCLRDRACVRFFATQMEQGDRYFVKLGLIELLEQLDPTDQFLYLDYDHLVLDQLHLEATPSRCIRVSSEVKAYAAKLSLVGADLDAVIPGSERYHYNNSLIFSTVATLRKQVGTTWLEMYQELEGVAYEQREEVAFFYRRACLRWQATTRGAPRAGTLWTHFQPIRLVSLWRRV